MQSRILLTLIIPMIFSCVKQPSGIAVKHIHEFDSTLNYRIDIDYPAFTDSHASIINQQITGCIDSNILAFKRFILDFEEASIRTLDYTYEIKSNDNQFISISQKFAWAVPGVERILYQHSNINYNRIGNYFIGIDGLFKPNSRFRDSLRVLAVAELQRDSGCILDSMERFTNFYFNHDTLFFNLTLTDQSQCDDYSIAVNKGRLERLLK